MAYDQLLARRVRNYLSGFPHLLINEKKMFGGLAFLINGKMCVNVSGQNLMCRFDPALTESLSAMKGFLPMVMSDKEYKGYCYIEPHGIQEEVDFQFWIQQCLTFNNTARSSKKVAPKDNKSMDSGNLT